MINEGNCCGLINAISVCNKAPNIINLILEKSLDLPIITETWLFSGDDAKMRDITPEGYCMFSNSRDARRGGGVAIICQNGLICKMKERNDIFESF